jgi:hypothetical protein
LGAARNHHIHGSDAGTRIRQMMPAAEFGLSPVLQLHFVCSGGSSDKNKDFFK